MSDGAVDPTGQPLCRIFTNTVNKRPAPHLMLSLTVSQRCVENAIFHEVAHKYFDVPVIEKVILRGNTYGHADQAPPSSPQGETAESSG